MGAACSGDGACTDGTCLPLPGGYCSRTACNTAGCPMGSTCFSVGTGEYACFQDCTAATECRQAEGYTCDADNTCYPGSGASSSSSSGGGASSSSGGTTGRGIGEACTSPSQCAGGACLGLPGGYCSTTSCTTGSCPTGSSCFSLSAGGSACFKTCSSASECRTSEGYTCDGDNTCYPGTVDPACSAQNPTGTCPSGQVCNNGTCAPFTCTDTRFEPNESHTAATPAPTGTTTGLALCSNDQDWYRATVPTDEIFTLGATFQNASGDLDLTVHDASGACLGGRVAQSCNWARNYETGTEFLSVLNNGTGSRQWNYKLAGRNGATNLYSLVTSTTPWSDGAVCTDTFPQADCEGRPNGTLNLIQFPMPDTADAFLGDGYRFDSMSNYRWLRRETIMLVRHAIRETQLKFTSTRPLGLIDMCQQDGITPGYDVGDPRHPESTHDQGGNIDIAYYTTLANTLGYNEARIICDANEGTSDGAFCTSGASSSHVVDLPRQVYFMATLFNSSRVRVIGVDKIIGPLLQAEAARQANLGWITTAQRDRFTSKMAFGDGWPYHHHHIHVSLNWWGSAQVPAGDSSPGCGFDLVGRRASMQ